MPRKQSNRREFLQLANKYRPGKDKVGGWFLSEKLDGTRCLWDGGISRGCPTDNVPWASLINPKTGKYKDKIKPVATGLWSRYGNPIMAPDWFLNKLPCIPLDGELWAGRGKFQLCRSICGGDDPDPRFDQIKFAVYGMPPVTGLFNDGEIKNANFHATFSYAHCVAWVEGRQREAGIELFTLAEDALFFHELAALQRDLDGLEDFVFMHRQVKLPEDHDEAAAAVEIELNKIIALGGEGLVLRHPSSPWTPKRVSSLLKYKPFDDDEGTLVGFTSGRETGKGSKHLGKIGALILDYQGKRLELSGLTDEEREFATPAMSTYAAANPGENMPPATQGKHFKVGQKITFLFRELSDDGIPKEARYFRKRDDE